MNFFFIISCGLKKINKKKANEWNKKKIKDFAVFVSKKKITMFMVMDGFV